MTMRERLRAITQVGIVVTLPLAMLWAEGARPDEQEAPAAVRVTPVLRIPMQDDGKIWFWIENVSGRPIRYVTNLGRWERGGMHSLDWCLYRGGEYVPRDTLINTRMQNERDVKVLEPGGRVLDELDLYNIYDLTPGVYEVRFETGPPLGWLKLTPLKCDDGTVLYIEVANRAATTRPTAQP